MNIMRPWMSFLASGILAAMALQACSSSPDLPDREVNTFVGEIETPLVEEMEDSPTCHYKASFISLKPASAQDTVAHAINAVLQGLVYGVQNVSALPGEAYGKASEAYVADYRENLLPAYEMALKEEDDMTRTAYLYNYEYEVNTVLTLSCDSIYNYEINSYVYTGGAHPNTYVNWANISARTGHLLELEEVFKQDAEEQLRAVLAEHLVPEIAGRLEMENLKTFDDLVASGVLFEPVLPLPQNFLITDEGIRFVYNRYEIAPYALGEIELMVPYEELEDLLML